jgi:hypothetical protein
LVEFANASLDEQAEHLVSELKSALKVSLKAGVGRFEGVLAPLGLGGPVDEGVRRALFELSEVRNVVVHRAGVVDRRFMEKCPWRSVSSNAMLHVSRADVALYQAAALWYVSELHRRCIITTELPDERALSTLALVLRQFASAVDARIQARGAAIPELGEQPPLSSAT